VLTGTVEVTILEDNSRAYLQAHQHRAAGKQQALAAILREATVVAKMSAPSGFGTVSGCL
jgi:hypothetical protein